MRRAIQIPISLCVTVAVLWLAAGLAAVFVLPQNIALSAKIPFLLAACVELLFFAALGWPVVRHQLAERFPARQFSALLGASALPPFLIYAMGTGTFTFSALLILAGLSAAVAFWFTVLPKGALRDIGFLVLVAAVMLGGLFPAIYVDAAPKLQAEFLGRVLWIRLGIAASLMLRPQPGTGFGFWPTAREWRIGALGFIAILPPLLALGFLLEFVAVRDLAQPGWLVALITLGSFLGFLWVVALSEEYFLRGLLHARVVEACAPVPVTAKIRLGWTRQTINAVDVARAVEEAGGAALTVHGRTAAERFGGAADWRRIAEIKPHLRRDPPDRQRRPEDARSPSSRRFAATGSTA